MRKLLTLFGLAVAAIITIAAYPYIQVTDEKILITDGKTQFAAVISTYTNYCDGRFTIWNTNQDVVVDNDSGRTWTRDANIGGVMNWTNAIAYCSNLTNATYSDWRLPSRAEFSRVIATNGLLDADPSANEPALPLGHPFINVQLNFYWSSTLTGFPDRAWAVGEDGTCDQLYIVTLNYVWPCRGP